MFYSLKSRLWFSNIVVIGIAISLILIFVNIFAGHEFNIYKVNELEKAYGDIYDIVSAQYQDGRWDLWVLETVGSDILDERNIVISLYNSNSIMLYDSVSASSGSANSMPSTQSGHGHMMRGRMGMEVMPADEPILQIERYNEKEYPIMDSNNQVGTLILASTEYYDTNDLNYLNGITQIIIITGVIAAIIAIVISNFFSNKIIKPITNITNVAGDISQGNYGKLVDEKTTISELRNLILAINNLSGNLEQHEMLRKRLTQDVAHELRTPISTMQGNLEAVLDGVWEMDGDKIKSFYEEVLRLSRLVSDLNSLSKYENTVLNKSIFDINELLTHVIGNFEAATREKEIRINAIIESINLYADKDKFIQVFTNLIANAVSFTPEKGEIYINTALSNDKRDLTITVSDAGIGISEEDLPYIFERFYRADKSRNRKSGGAGIGLSVVKAVVEAHNGKIGITSKLGMGTKVILSIPVEV